MKTPIFVGSIALALAGVLAMGQALAENSRPLTRQTAHEKAVEREELRRVALEDHQKRREEFKRNCTKKDLGPAQFEACRAAYRKL
jgi:hypothetical protein